MGTEYIYFSNAGSPAPGLTPTWSSLVDEDGNNESQPSITEIGGGWYKYNIAPDAPWFGVVDGGASLTNASERYIPVYHNKFGFMYDIKIVPVYNENSDSLTYMAFMLKNGQLIETGLTNCTLEVYDKTHSLLFTISQTSNTNGVFILTKSGPGLVANTPYYVVASITLSGVVHESLDTYFSLE